MAICWMPKSRCKHCRSQLPVAGEAYKIIRGVCFVFLYEQPSMAPKHAFCSLPCLRAQVPKWKRGGPIFEINRGDFA